MKITVKGEQAEINENTSVSALLDLRKVKMPDMVSVELNGQILERQKFDDTVLKEGDKVEFLYYMGGGAAKRHADV